MRTLINRSAFYVPARMPEPPALESLALYVFDELQKISNAVEVLSILNLPVTHVAPLRPRDGDTYLADGTNWNPGAGKGVYTYYNSVWNKLG